jgi:hypothetical protein
MPSALTRSLTILEQKRGGRIINIDARTLSFGVWHLYGGCAFCNIFIESRMQALGPAWCGAASDSWTGRYHQTVP